MNASGSRRAILFFIIAAALIASDCNLSYAAQAVTIKNVGGIYYLVELDLANNSHYDVGRQYAEAIKANVPDYETRIDSFLNYMQAKLGVDLATLKARASDIWQNIPEEYQDEIRGMQSVFSYATDKLGDGRMSRNELLIFQIFGDVGRTSGCSASAAFGTASSTGKTIVGRNLEWIELPNSELQAIHAVVILKNKDKSLASFAFLGDMAFISAVSDDRIFAALLDVETNKPYPPTAGKRSYMMDLRYAMENMKTLREVADYMSGKDYAYSHLIFLADENSAFVLENDIGSPSRGLRSSISPLRPGITWDHPNAIVTVNCFLLSGNADTITGMRAVDADRWNSFSRFYEKFLSGNGTINADKMKEIAGYTGKDGKHSTGALFRPGDHYPSIHLIIMRMDTLETWAAFAPVGAQPFTPEYIRVFEKNPFNRNNSTAKTIRSGDVRA